FSAVSAMIWSSALVARVSQTSGRDFGTIALTHVIVSIAQKPVAHSLSFMQPRQVFVPASQTRFPQLLLSTHSTHVWSGPHAGSGSAHTVASRHCTHVPDDVSQIPAGPVQSESAWHAIGATHSF